MTLNEQFRKLKHDLGKTIKQISNDTKLSESTVSRAIHPGGTVSKHTIAVIEATYPDFRFKLEHNDPSVSDTSTASTYTTDFFTENDAIVEEATPTQADTSNQTTTADDKNTAFEYQLRYEQLHSQRTQESINPILTHALERLITPDAQNTISYIWTVLTKILQDNIEERKLCYPLMYMMAASLQSSTLSNWLPETELSLHQIQVDLAHLRKYNILPESQVNSAQLILREATICGEKEARFNALRTVFYLLYEHWKDVINLDETYDMLNFVFLPLDDADSNLPFRNRIFDTILCVYDSYLR